MARTLLQAMSPWCSTAARRSPKPKDAVQSRAGMPVSLRKRRQRRRSLVRTRARRASGAQLHVMHSKLTRWKRRAEDAETLARYQPGAPDNCGVVYQWHTALITPRTGAGAGDRNQFLSGWPSIRRLPAKQIYVGEIPTPESNMPAWRIAAAVGLNPPPDSNMRASEIVARRAHHLAPPAEGNPAYLADSESAASAFESQAGDQYRRQAHTDEHAPDKREAASASLAPATTGLALRPTAGPLPYKQQMSVRFTQRQPVDVREHVQRCAPLITGR